jgi:hypothetical protein
MRHFIFHAAAATLFGLLVLAQASSAYAESRAPHGIYATIDISDYISSNNLPQQGADATVSAFYDTMLGNPAIAGLDIEVHWDFAQPNPPPAAFNWGYVDDAFTEAAAYGKTVHLDATAGFNSPLWLLDASQPTGIPSCDPLFKGNKAPNCGTVTFNYYAENTDQDGGNHMLVLPLPWSATYISNWHAFLTALQARYGSNPALVAITMAGPTAASPEMIMPNNYNTCSNDGSNSDSSGRCYTCPHGTMPPCTQSNGMLAEDMWNTLFQDTSSYPQNSDEAFIDQWTKTINFYESLFANVTLDITPADGAGFPSFGSGFPFTPSAGNVLYHPECDFSDTGGSTYVNHNYQTRSCDAVTTILTSFMNTLGGSLGDGMASETSGMEAQDPTALGSFSKGGNTGDVGVPGVKYLANYTLVPGMPRQEVTSGAQFDHSFSGGTTEEEGCPQGSNGCPGISPEQAEYNVLQVFFLGTPGAHRFGGTALAGSEPTPTFLQVFNQDVTYAQASTSVAQPITDPTTGATFRLSAQDMLDMAAATLLPSPLVAAVLPESRSVPVGGTATAFATIINSGTTAASGCSIAPPGNLPASFVYQTTNPQNNALTGTANTPVGIAAGASQSFVIALTPSAAIAPTDVPFNFACTSINPAPIVSGLDTLLLSASIPPSADIVALAATSQNDGIVHVTGAPMQGAFAVATINLGASASITAAATTGIATLPVTITLCQTNPQSGQCLQPPSASATTTVVANATPTFAIFVSASGTVPFDPADNRIFVTFTDGTNAVRGETSVAVETQ